MFILIYRKWSQPYWITHGQNSVNTNCAVNKPNQRVMQQSELFRLCLDQRKQTVGVMFFFNFLLSGVVPTWLSRLCCGAVSQLDIYFRKPLWSELRTQVEHRESLNVSLKVEGERKRGTRRRKRRRGTRRERCYRFHLLLRAGVKGVAENRWPTFSLRQTPAARPPRIQKKTERSMEGDSEKRRRRYRKRETSSLTRQTWKGREAQRQKETGKVLTVILFDSSFLPSPVRDWAVI